MKQEVNNIDNKLDGLHYILLKIWGHIGSRLQKQFGFLLILMLISAITEIISMGAIIPFLTVLVSPERLFTYPYVSTISSSIEINAADQLILPLTILFIVAAVAAGGVRILLLWLTTRLSYACGTELSVQMYERTLYQPYKVHVSRNSSEIIAGISHKVGSAINALYQLTSLISAIILVIFITSALFVIDPYIATISVITFSTGYGIITIISRRILRRNSCRIAKESNYVIKSLQEGLGGIRDVIMDGTQQVHAKIYKRSDLLLRRAQGNNTFISIGPRHIMETIGMTIIAALAYILASRDDGLNSAIPILGALAIGAQRLLPAAQQIYGSWSSLAGSQRVLADVINLLEQPISQEINQYNNKHLSVESIQFDKVCFSYDEQQCVLQDINFSIKKGMRIGIVGATGSGKSTALDILMGLLEPTDGQVLLDGIPLSNENIRAWQQTIAHVPQSIYLSDSSVSENIAFGVAVDDVDFEQVKLAARRANIAEYIENLPNDYNTLVGERGVRLSGGQRQRIGIARALYKNAKVLVFDEATSALDSATEKLIMEAIDELSRDLTIIMIAHRLTTVQNCDEIIEFKNGHVVAKGTYEELLENSLSFQKMANTTSIAS